MEESKAITYSLLAHIRNSGTFIKGPIDIFIPLIKRVLHKLNESGINKGQNISEIKILSDKLYNIDIPTPVLKTILQNISQEVNIRDNNSFILYKDGSFIIKNYLFSEFEDKIDASKREVESLEKLFEEFCSIYDIKLATNKSIFDFIDKNKISISKYLANRQTANSNDYTKEALFVDFFKKIPKIYDLIKKIYLGSILSSYLEYKTENLNQGVELVFDTNFIISLIDLNTPDSTNTCKKLLEVSKKLGYSFTILQDTVEESKRLLYAKAEFLDTSFLARKVNPEDIYNACERRKLTKIDLERISDNLDSELAIFGINTIYDTSKYKNKARFSDEFEALKKYRNTEFAALHDAIAILYVKEKRKRRIKEFEKVTCWFVNNTTSHDFGNIREFEDINSGYQSEIIRADELLNILWLSNLSINTSVSSQEIADIGLRSLVALTLNDSLPKSSIIRELDENIQKYAQDVLSDKDIIDVTTRIVTRQLRNLSELNEIAKRDKEQFVHRLKKEAQKQEEEEKNRFQKIEKALSEIENRIISMSNSSNQAKTELSNNVTTSIKTPIVDKFLDEKTQENNINKRLLEIENKYRKQLRELFIKKQTSKWRKKSWILLGLSIMALILGLLFILKISNWDLNIARDNVETWNQNIIFSTIISGISLIFTIVLIPSLASKYHNHSNIDAFKRNINIPEELKELTI